MHLASNGADEAHHQSEKPGKAVIKVTEKDHY